jgi:hypothetical protein
LKARTGNVSSTACLLDGGSETGDECAVGACTLDVSRAARGRADSSGGWAQLQKISYEFQLNHFDLHGLETELDVMN